MQTAGACLLELLDPSRRFADHGGPDHERGVPGRHAIFSGAVGFGLDAAESRRLQAALLDANVLHRVADTSAADLESPFFNGVKVFYGGRPGAMQTEIRVNGERHEAASAAMAALDLPEPTVFTAATTRCCCRNRLSTGSPRGHCPAASRAICSNCAPIASDSAWAADSGRTITVNSSM